MQELEVPTMEQLQAMKWEDMVKMDSGPDESNPYEKLSMDRAIPELVFAERFRIANALVTRIQRRNWLRKIIIDLGTRKGEVYDQVNKARYVIDDQIDSLKEKKEAIDGYFYYKSAELRHQP